MSTQSEHALQQVADQINEEFEQELAEAEPISIHIRVAERLRSLASFVDQLNDARQLRPAQARESSYVSTQTALVYHPMEPEDLTHLLETFEGYGNGWEVVPSGVHTVFRSPGIVPIEVWVTNEMVYEDEEPVPVRKPKDFAARWVQDRVQW